MQKTALITGVTGQDGAYLSELLLSKGYIVHGIKRRASSFNTTRIDHLYRDPHIEGVRFFLHHGDLTDSSNLIRIIQQTRPDEIYNLAAQSHVAVSFESPEYTADVDAVGTLRMLEAIRILGLEKKTRFYQASSSELYGLVQETIPLLSYLSTVVEHSFWAFIFFSLVFVEMITSPRLNFPRLISLVSIATLMRQPSFLALLPIILMFALQTCRTKVMWRWIKESAVIFLPLLLFLPVLSSSLLHGTPSTNPLGHGAMLEKVKLAVESGIVWDSVIAAFPIWWLPFIPFAFLPLSAELKKLNAGLLLFGVMAVCMYYSINPDLWGFAKYQAEYAAPVLISEFESIDTALILFQGVQKYLVHKYDQQIHLQLFSNTLKYLHVQMMHPLAALQFQVLPHINLYPQPLLRLIFLKASKAGQFRSLSPIFFHPLHLTSPTMPALGLAHIVRNSQYHHFQMRWLYNIFQKKNFAWFLT